MTRHRRAKFAAVAIAVLSAIVARVISYVALDDVAHVMDEIAYVLQAKTLAQLHLSAPVVPPRAAFSMWYVDDRAARFSIFPPGWPAVLAIGMRLGLGRWVNPLLHGLATWMVSLVGARLGGDRARLTSAALYGLSAQTLLLGASAMSHTLVALAAAVAMWAALHARRRASARHALALGAAAGVIVLTRPLCAIGIAVGATALAMGTRRRPWRELAVFAMRAAIPLALASLLVGAYNHALTGDAFRFPQTVWFDEHLPPHPSPFFRYRPGCNALGFGSGCNLSIPDARHTPMNALSNTGDNIQAWTLLLAGGPLFYAMAILATVRRRRVALALLATPIAVVLLYGLYWYAGTCYGARFYHAGVPAFAVVAGLGFAGLRSPKAITAAAASIGLVTAIALAGSAREVAAGYWGTDGSFRDLARDWDQGRALVMVAFDSNGVPMRPLRWTGFTSPSEKSIWHNSVRALGALGENDPFYENEVVFAKYHPALAGELIENFGDRRPFVYVAQAGGGGSLVPYEKWPWAGQPSPLPRPPDNFEAVIVQHDRLVDDVPTENDP